MQNTKRIEDQIWSAAPVPLYQKHFRREIEGQARPINYNTLLQDKEFTNMLSFRLRMRESSTAAKIIAVNETNEVLNLIVQELK
jgi:hypothetical protein